MKRTQRNGFRTTSRTNRNDTVSDSKPTSNNDSNVKEQTPSELGNITFLSSKNFVGEVIKYCGKRKLVPRTEEQLINVITKMITEPIMDERYILEAGPWLKTKSKVILSFYGNQSPMNSLLYDYIQTNKKN